MIMGSFMDYESGIRNIHFKVDADVITEYMFTGKSVTNDMLLSQFFDEIDEEIKTGECDGNLPKTDIEHGKYGLTVDCLYGSIAYDYALEFKRDDIKDFLISERFRENKNEEYFHICPEELYVDEDNVYDTDMLMIIVPVRYNLDKIIEDIGRDKAIDLDKEEIERN